MSRTKRATSSSLSVPDTEARHLAADRLKRAARWYGARYPVGEAIELGAKGAAGRVWFRFDYPGVLSVIDADDGALLARSVAGKPDELDPAFVPPERRWV